MNHLIILAGPTGVGKSQLAIDLAKKIQGEVISCDSMQIYDGLDIGSAKVRNEDMQGVPHHMLSVVSAFESYSSARYQREAEAVLQDILSRGKVPILSGGTGLYISALIYPMKFATTKSDAAIRQSLEERYDLEGGQALWEEIFRKDPKASEKIHPNNKRRVVRALEVMAITGQPFSSFKEKKVLRQDLKIHYYWLNKNRPVLYQNINDRVDQMMDQGLLEEVQFLKSLGLNKSYQSMEGIGYKELLVYLEGDCTLEESLAAIKQNSRKYAKRQITWFKNDENASLLCKDIMTDSQIIAKIEEEVRLP